MFSTLQSGLADSLLIMVML